MYSRNYYPDEQERVTLPDNYDGTAFSEHTVEQSTQAATEPQFAEEHHDDSVLASIGKSSLFSGLFGKGSLLGIEGLRMPKIGTEELLIIATAAFLFFSKNGDRESALILLLLLFIG